MKKITLIKSDGTHEPFQEEKLAKSLFEVGADERIIERILQEIQPHLYNHMPTQKLYSKVYQLLKKYARTSAAKYQLKQAVAQLGPAGYPFEKFIGKLLQFQGYITHIGVQIKGKSVNHEIDILAQKENMTYYIECKFHQPGKKVDVKVPMYIFSRVLDLIQSYPKIIPPEKSHKQGWIITNTHFTADAIQFATSYDLRLTGWDYPEHGNLKQRIELAGLHPITCLTYLTLKEKQFLVQKGIILCHDLIHKKAILNQIINSSKRREKVLNEALSLCHPDHF